jgi:phosphoribosylformimino-5-aminoimidazole carboxamide ribotide isomerase
MLPKKLNENKKFNIYTAIDIMDEKCVRLFQGKFDNSETYNNNPDFVAKRWKSQGAEYLHVVDLDGARTGVPHNLPVIKMIIQDTKIPVQVGGGIRSMESIKKLLDAGASRVILGSVIVKNPDLVKQALAEFGGKKIVLGLDCNNGFLAVQGWQESSTTKAVDIVKDFTEHGLEIIEYTDIGRDGTLEGPNIQALSAFLEECPDVRVICSGGVGTLEDVRTLKSLQDKYPNVDGVIIGKALYAGKIKPSELYTDEIYN